MSMSVHSLKIDIQACQIMSSDSFALSYMNHTITKMSSECFHPKIITNFSVFARLWIPLALGVHESCHTVTFLFNVKTREMSALRR